MPAMVGDPAAVLGRTLAAPVRRGAPLTDLSVVSRPLTSAYPGRVATPVRVADGGVVDLLRVGDLVDLVAADPQGRAAARTVASRVTVIAIPGACVSRRRGDAGPAGPDGGARRRGGRRRGGRTRGLSDGHADPLASPT